MAQSVPIKIGGIYYRLNHDNKTAEVTRGDDKYSCSVVIPQSICYAEKTYAVNAIGASAFEGCNELNTVAIPESVTIIGEKAFCGCYWFESVTIPNHVTAIGDFAFKNCAMLTTVFFNAENCVTNPISIFEAAQVSQRYQSARESEEFRMIYLEIGTDLHL